MQGNEAEVEQWNNTCSLLKFLPEEKDILNCFKPTTPNRDGIKKKKEKQLTIIIMHPAFELTDSNKKALLLHLIIFFQFKTNCAFLFKAEFSQYCNLVDKQQKMLSRECFNEWEIQQFTNITGKAGNH